MRWRCRKVGKLLAAYVDGELSLLQREQVGVHLRRCSACARREEEYTDQDGLVEAALSEPLSKTQLASGFEERLFETLPLTPEYLPTGPPSQVRVLPFAVSRTTLIWASVGCAALVGLAILGLTKKRGTRSRMAFS